MPIFLFNDHSLWLTHIFHRALIEKRTSLVFTFHLWRWWFTFFLLVRISTSLPGLKCAPWCLMFVAIYLWFALSIFTFDLKEIKCWTNGLFIWFIPWWRMKDKGQDYSAQRTKINICHAKNKLLMESRWQKETK